MQQHFSWKLLYHRILFIIIRFWRRWSGIRRSFHKVCNILICFLLLLLFVEIFKNDNVENSMIDDTRRDLIVETVLYFNESKFYPKNTMVILVMGNETLANLTKNYFGCVSTNLNNDFYLDQTFIRKQYLQQIATHACPFVGMIITCQTLPNPDKFYLVDTKENGGQMVELKFEEPERGNYGIISCTSSIYFGERWQLYATSIEYHSYFGVKKQVYYLMSALDGVFQLLKEYERIGMIDLRFWSIPDVPTMKSLENIWNRDQLSTLNDCFMRYRETADFIIVHDPDELLWMSSGQGFRSEFEKMWTPDVGFLNIRTFDATIDSERHWSRFDIGKTLSSVTVSKNQHHMKAVYKPELIETIWVHWTDFYNTTKYIRFWPENDYSIFIHIRNWNFDLEKLDAKNKISTFPFNATKIEEISKIFKYRMEQFKLINRQLKHLKLSERYYSTFDECMKPPPLFDRCLAFSSKNCHVPNYPNLICHQFLKNYEEKRSTKNSNFYVLRDSRLEKSTNGCQLKFSEKFISNKARK